MKVASYYYYQVGWNSTLPHSEIRSIIQDNGPFSSFFVQMTVSFSCHQREKSKSTGHREDDLLTAFILHPTRSDSYSIWLYWSCFVYLFCWSVFLFQLLFRLSFLLFLGLKYRESSSSFSQAFGERRLERRETFQDGVYDWKDCETFRERRIKKKITNMKGIGGIMTRVSPSKAGCS